MEGRGREKEKEWPGRGSTREGKGEKEQEWECREKVREGKREGRGRRR